MATVGGVGTPSSRAGATTGSGTSTVTNPSATLSQDQFLQLLTAQLKNQNPLDPVTDTDFASQLAQFSTLSTMQQLNTNSQQLLQIQQINQGAALVGKTVAYGGTATSTTSGRIDAVNYANGQISLKINGNNVLVDQIQSILSSTAT